MKKILLALACIIAPLVGFTQNAELVITGTTPVSIVEHGGTAATPIYIVIGNPNATSAANPGIKTVTGSDGYIISENEYDIVKWNIGTSIGTYTVPWGYTNASPLTYYFLPLSVDIITAGAGATGSLLFSTWHTIADQALGIPSTTGDPSDVTGMGSFWNGLGSPGTADNSWNVVDRFWVIDPSAAGSAYTTKPTIGGANGIKFSYISATGIPAEVVGPNTFTESNLLAQRFNTSVGWGDWLGQGSTDVGGGNVGTAFSGPVAPANFYRSWTLSNSIDPLPITLSTFTVECTNGAAFISWVSQSELDNAYYTVEKSTDNEHFETVGTVKAIGSGTSDDPESYNITDNNPYPGTSYYYLYQTDVDGKETQAGIVMFNGCGGGSSTTTVNGYNTTNYVEVDINAVSADNFNISLVNMLGQNVLSEFRSVALGSNEIRLDNNFSPGIYILSVRNDKVNFAKKLVLGVR